VLATLKARVAEVEAELAQAEERSRGHRADFERERADRPATRRAELFPQYRHFSSRLAP
jgi:multidrug resistance efflux pump